MYLCISFSRLRHVDDCVSSAYLKSISRERNKTLLLIHFLFVLQPSPWKADEFKSTESRVDMALSVLRIQPIEKQRRGTPRGGAKEQVLMSRANKYPESKIRAHQTHTFLMEDHKDCDPGHQCDGTTQFTECEEGSMCRRNSKITVTDSQIQQKACFKGFSYSSKGE